jgi:ABC-2 type transport system permease protein
MFAAKHQVGAPSSLRAAAEAAFAPAFTAVAEGQAAGEVAPGDPERVALVASVGAAAAVGLRSGIRVTLTVALTIGLTRIVTHVIGGLCGVAHWVDQSTTLADLTDHALSTGEWARVGTTVLLWLVLPLAIGAWRVLRGEIR